MVTTPVQSTNGTDTAYVNTLDYELKADKLQNLVSVMDTLQKQNIVARRLRYTEIDIEAEKADGKLKPDEVFVPQHIIDTNIRREQSSYVQFVTQSNRAVVLTDKKEPWLDCAIIERDVTNKLRFEGWQMSMFADIDGFQQNGYGVMKVKLDETQEGGVAHEFVQLGDLGFVSDTRDIQQSEMLAQNHYFSKSRLMFAASDKGWGFDAKQLKMVIDGAPNADTSGTGATSAVDQSLYKIQEVFFRYNGVVQVAWACFNICNDWLRKPRPLYIGQRQTITINGQVQMMPDGITPQSTEVHETLYPFYIFPYLITENNTISQLKGRAYLDQDTQTAVTSLISSVCTAYRRGSGLYFAKDSDDPNADVLQQKNIFFQTGCLIDQKVKTFNLPFPSADILSGIQLLVTANQSETSKVNFAAQNRKDSRKTATEIDAAQAESSTLSTVQVVLFSNALRDMYRRMYNIVRSRVLAKLVPVDELLYQLYQREYILKPAGDIDVIERQKRLKMMMDAWPVMQQTPAAAIFLADLLTLALPEYAPKYIKIFIEDERKKASEPPPKSPEQLQAEMEMQMEQLRFQLEQQKQQFDMQMEMEKHKLEIQRQVVEGQLDAAEGQQQLAQSNAEFQQKMQQNALEAQQKLSINAALGQQKIELAKKQAAAKPKPTNADR